MNVILEGFEQGATSGTWRIVDGSAPSTPLASYNTDGTVHLRLTGHDVAAALPGEGLAYYFARVAPQIGANPDIAGSLLLMGDAYNVGNTGDPILDIAVHVDAFANPTPYGLGSAGAPPVAAGPGAPGAGPAPGESTEAINNGTLEPNGVNTPWMASNPGQVQFVRAKGDGVYSAVCDGSVPVYVGVGFYPGVATFADLVAGGLRGTQTAELAVKDGDHFCYAHEGNPGNRMRASGR